MDDFRRIPEVLERFVAIEGLDGSGTSTLLGLLDERLKDLRISHLCTFEPTDGEVGQLIRKVLQGRIPVEPQTLALLFAADRTEHVQDIRERVGKGQIVITDRYLFSSLAYQGIICGFEYVLSLNRDFPLPSQILFLDTPLDLCQERIEGRAGRDLFDGRSTQVRVLEAYERAFTHYQETAVELRRVDGSLEPAEILDKVWRSLEKFV